MTYHDVIVAGGGPAGASCAKALIDAGIDALVLEKDHLPRYKTCSGVLLGQSQVLLEKIFKAPVPESVYCSGTKIIMADDIREWRPSVGYTPYVWELDKDGVSFSRTYLNIWRDRFDQWLLDQSGAPYQDGMRVNAVNAGTDLVKVSVLKDAATNKVPVEYTCRYLVGADGGASAIRRILNKESPLGPEPAMNVVVMQSYFKLKNLGALKKGEWAVFFLPEISDLICCVHQKDEYLVLHVGGFRGRKLRDSMERFTEFLASEFSVQLGEWWRDEGCQVELAPPFLGRGNVLLTGEAGGFMYLNGEGISAAMDSGYRCGQAIAKAMTGKVDVLEIYNETTKDIAAHVRKCIDNAHFFATTPSLASA